MSLLFLDIDGVLNDHRTLPNGYAQMKYKCVKEFCRILDTCPDVEVIVSSAWRYMMISNPPCINERGLEYLMCLFGAPYDSVNKRICGTNASDEETCLALGLMEEGAGLDYGWLKENGCLLRREQILTRANGRPFVVLDDLDLEMPELVKTDGNVGLTKSLADRVIKALQSIRD